MKAWVVGRGLLGKTLNNVLKENGRSMFEPNTSFDWNNHDALKSKITKAVTDFTSSIDDSYEIYWCAGQGTMNSTAEAMQVETQSLQIFLDALKSAGLPKGKLMFASSAGAIYATSTDEVTTEASTPAPSSAYGEAKLKQEELIKEWGKATGNTTLIARLSTLYGTGQSHGKKQGLLTHIARSMLKRMPIHIFVPLDTMRDYLHVRDAAQDIRMSIDVVSSGMTMKIIASEQPTTIAEIIATFRRLTRTNPAIVTSISTLKNPYPHRMQFASKVLTDARYPHRTSLLIGIAEIFAHEKLQMASRV